MGKLAGYNKYTFVLTRLPWPPVIKSRAFAFFSSSSSVCVAVIQMVRWMGMVANGLSIQQADANISSWALISHTLVVGHGCGSALSGESTFHSYPLQQVSHAIEHTLFALSFSIFFLSRSIHFDASQLIFDFPIFYLFVHFL